MRLPRPRTSLPSLAAALIGAVLALVLSAAADLRADPSYPALTGRVVDEAGVMSPDAKTRLDAKLADLESRSGIQLVVATVKSLGGGDIESYANGLFRFWKLGEARKNNGVLLLVAPGERRVRIEVGYGEEGTLTDALSKVIITNAMVPRFKSGDFEGGIGRGVDDIIAVLTTDSAEWQKRPTLREDRPPGGGFDALVPLLIFGVIIIVLWRSSRRGGGGGRGSGTPWIIPPVGGGWGGSGGFGGGFGGGGFGGGSGGGFSGGGGSSGGGGASGSW